MSALTPTPALLPEGWTVTTGYLLRQTYRRQLGPIVAEVVLAHAGRPKGAWTAGAILPSRNDSDGLNVTMRTQELPTREEAMKAAEKLATRMTIWIVGRARELAGFGDAPAGARL